MSILTYNSLVELVESGVIENVPMENINGASIDLTLAGEFYIEDPRGGIVFLADKNSPHMIKRQGSADLRPGDFCLAATEQVFHLPNDITAIYVLKSSLARAGLNHLNAGYCDPGWNGSVLTLEFHNVLSHHTLVLEHGAKAGQMYFFRGEPVPEEFSYAVRGNYNGDKSVQQSKGVR